MAPTVVATLDYVPSSLALDGADLYVTVAETDTVAGVFDGKVQTVAKTAVGATEAAGGGITTLASGLHQAGTIAVAGGSVYWAGTVIVSGRGTIFAVPTAGGSVTEATGDPYSVVSFTRIPIANSVLYAENAYGNISAFPLTGTAGGAGQVTYTPPPTASGILALDSDGTSVFFFVDISPFAGGTNETDLDQVPVGGGAATFLAKTNIYGTVDSHLIHDASTIYWSDRGFAQTGNLPSGAVYALPKTGGTPTLLATFPIGTGAVQLVLDGNDFYALTTFSLVRFPKSGGTPVTLASSADAYVSNTANMNAIALATDDTYVYWLWASHGQILKLAK